MKSAEMAKLFDLDSQSEASSEPSDYSTTANEEQLKPFDNKSKEVASMMDKEDDIILDAMKSAKSDDLESDEEIPEIPEDVDGDEYSDEVEKDLKEFETKEPEPEISNTSQESSSEPESDNPLGLFGSELNAYHDINKKYPDFFTLYDGSVSFKEFYRYKVKTLASLLARYPLLDTRDLQEEVGKIKTDHSVGSAAISPDLLRRKIDECQQQRSRLSEILITAFEQAPLWSRFCEMLRSKLWKDHELKGAHRRDGLTLEHMTDMEDYVGALEGLLSSAKHVDGILKASAESLSRQLSCIQLDQPTGFSYDSPKPKPVSQASGLDNYDSVGNGSVIAAPERTGKPSVVDYGVEPDELASLG